MNLSAPIKGVDVWESHILLWSSEDADVFELTAAGIQHLARFKVGDDVALAIHENFIFQTEVASVRVLSFQGLLKQTLPLDERQGHALCLDVCRDFLVLVTTNCLIRIWQLDGADVKPQGPISGRKVKIHGDDKLVVTSVKCNSDCSRISLLVKYGLNAGENTHLVIFDTIIDRFFFYDFRHMHRVPTAHCWDTAEPRLIVCSHGRCIGARNTRSRITNYSTVCNFRGRAFGAGAGKLMKVKLDSRSRFLALEIPYYHILTNSSAKNITSAFTVEKITVRAFIGLEDVGIKEKAALVEFNYNLVLGNLTNAYEAIGAIEDKKIWQSVACNCVKTKRVDVALHCFAVMNNASAAAFVRASLHEPEEDARIAAVAIQLGLVDAARELYLGCKRFDLLRHLYETCGEWDKAIEVASKHDRVHLKGTLHAYAKHLESLGNIKDAVHHYEVSGSHRHEVPRMLYTSQQVKELQEYVDKSGDPPLQRWWGHFCEANNLLPQAIDYYTVAGDVTSLVRVYCFKGDYSTAAALVLESSDAAAAFSLARQSTKEMMIQAAEYYEDKKKFEEAVLLYHKGGDLEKAINVCFRTQLYDALKAIAEDMDKDEDPALLAKCGEFLLMNKQIDKAVQLFIAAKQFHVALDLCLREGVILTDKMAEAMSTVEDTKSQESISLLHKIAEVFNAQGSYHLACKKYTHAGDRLTAMKLYSKAGDMDALASFYESCAQIEIDEYRDYKKALGAMTEALKYLLSSKSQDKDQKVQSIKSRITEVEQFVQASVRIGDLYALLIEFYCSQESMEQAYQVVEKMRARKIPLGPFVDQNMLLSIYQALGFDATEEDLTDTIGEEIISM
ncbi:hypothetical protein R1flu_003245 [Riccia fluitans]|uniref:Intraflagellar transport protein 140 n=1 Tax=Riccia fluitans TaxID=41844 RepID=A0ABD1Y8H5_9MARC